MNSLSSTSTKESIGAYFEAQGENINVQSVEVLENETAIVLLVNITEEGISGQEGGTFFTKGPTH